MVMEKKKERSSIFYLIKMIIGILVFLVILICVGHLLLVNFILWLLRWFLIFNVDKIVVNTFGGFRKDLKPVEVQWDFCTEFELRRRMDMELEPLLQVSIVSEELLKNDVVELVYSFEKAILGYDDNFFELWVNNFGNDIDIKFIKLQLSYLVANFGVIWFVNKLFRGVFISSLDGGMLSIIVMFIPEIFCLICMGWLLLLWIIVNKIYCKKFGFKVLGFSYLMILGLLFLLLVTGRDFELVFFGGEFHFFRFMKYCMILLVVLFWIYGLVCFLWSSERCLWNSYIFLILGMYLGFSLFFCIVGNFIIFFLVIEGLSYLTYLLIGVASFYRKGLEVITKYFLLNSVASGLMLFGIGVLYWIYGTITFFELSILSKLDSLWYLGGLFGFMCILIGLFFKIGIFPFHYWMGDVYYGCSSIVLLFLSTINELVIILIFLKFLYFFSGFISSLQILLVIFGCLTFFIGSIAGLLEKDIYRLVAYSSIINIGLLVICYSFTNLQGLVAFILYFIIYLSLIYILFLFLYSIEYRYNGAVLDLRNVEETILVYKYSWILAFVLTIIMFSLVGLPPLVGFFSKYIWLLVVSYKVGFIGMLVFIVMIPVGIVYYLRFIRYSVMETILNGKNLVLLESFFKLREVYVYVLLMGLLYIIFSWWFGYLFFVELEILIVENYMFVFN